MKELRPLKDSSRSVVSRALLEAARRDGLPEGARARALGALGLGTGVAAAGAAATTAAKASTVVLAKWIAIGAIGAVTAAVSAGYVVHRATPRAEPIRTPPVVAAVEVTVPVAPAPTFAPTVPSARPAHPQAANLTAPPAPEPPQSLSIQLEMLSRVRGALTAHDASRALGLLDAFERKNVTSPLAEEATVLRIEALSGAGRVTEARALAESFTARHPASAYLERIREATQSP
jgi:hypothetical protein